ncbi:hypothetical protein JCM12178A_18910 [Salidesulfovibrio brasiliensis]
MVLYLSAQTDDFRSHLGREVLTGHDEKVGMLHRHLKTDLAGTRAHRIAIRPVTAGMLCFHG